jgi:hypothetical protein
MGVLKSLSAGHSRGLSFSFAVNSTELAIQGRLPRRPLGKLVHVSSPTDTTTKRPKELGQACAPHPYDQSDLLFA